MENVNQSERACCCFALAGVRPNECLGLLGPNGAGKTTTFRMMTAAEAPSSGEVHVSGFSASTEAQKVWRSLGFCPQHDALWPELSTRQHLKLYAELKGANTKQTSLSRRFQMQTDRLPRQARDKHTRKAQNLAPAGLQASQTRKRQRTTCWRSWTWQSTRTRGPKS